MLVTDFRTWQQNSLHRKSRQHNDSATNILKVQPSYSHRHNVVTDIIVAVLRLHRNISVIFGKIPDIIVAWIPFQCILWDSHQSKNTSAVCCFISANMQITRFETHFEMKIVANSFALYFQADFVRLKVIFVFVRRKLFPRHGHESVEQDLMGYPGMVVDCG